MHDAAQLLANLSLIRNCAFHLVDKHNEAYPKKEDGRTLRRLAKSCASVEFSTSTHSAYFNYDEEAKTKIATWNDSGQVVSGVVDEVPELQDGRLFLALDTDDGRKFVITWEDE